MPALTDPRYMRQLLARHGFAVKKSLGQNFLIDPTVCPRMAAACGASETVGALEIGPGLGVLTRALSAQAGQVVAVELDTRLKPILSETLADCPNVDVVYDDAMKLDLAVLIRERFGSGPVAVCANLPYYITSPLLLRLLESRLPIQSVTVLVQKEAAQRLCALPGTRDCGAVSAAVSYFARPEILFGVSREAFFPVPKVDSAVIRLTMRETPPIAVDEPTFFRLVRAAFAQRRKTLINALAGAGYDKTAVLKAVTDSGLPATVRAEELTLPDLARLTAALATP